MQPREATREAHLRHLAAKTRNASPKEEICRNSTRFPTCLQSSLATMEGQNPKKGAKMPSIVRAKGPKM